MRWMDMSLSKLQELLMDREAWRATVHGVAKTWTRLSNWTELIYLYLWGFPAGTSGKESPASAGDIRDMGSILGLEDPLKEEMATHSSILAWKNPMDRGTFQAIVPGSQRLTHDWSDSTHMLLYLYWHNFPQATLITILSELWLSSLSPIYIIKTLKHQTFQNCKESNTPKIFV